MLCEHCHQKPATVHLTKIINDQKITNSLCEECASEYHNFSPLAGNFSFHKLLSSLLEQTEGTPIINLHKPDIKCDQCGFTLSQFIHYGKLGCSECYTTFNGNIKPLLRKIHGSNHHEGKVPKRTGRLYQLKRDIKKLRSELQVLVKLEEFEKAALVRDKIKEMEKKDNEKEE